jgi:hypothetical protein
MTVPTISNHIQEDSVNIQVWWSVGSRGRGKLVGTHGEMMPHLDRLEMAHNP